MMQALLDAVFLARLQFAFTIGFHIVLPAFSIGLASYLMVLEGLWLATGRQVYLDLFQFWLKAFSLVFAMGVVSGIVMSYEFGTNWGRFSDRAGPIIGPLMGYEVLTAFFLEAGFLGIMLFGLRRVGPVLHFLATCIVALGTLISAFWILSANSWMQTPQGYTVSADGRFLPADWAAVIFNPSFTVRLPHMVLASYLCVAFFVGAVGAWHLLHDATNKPARTMFSMAMWMALLAAPLQIVMGDIHGLNTLHYQPEKVAALEGDWDSGRGVPLILFGWPNMRTEHTDYALELPHLGSLILTHAWNGEIKGLKEWKAQDRPYAPVVFWAFRIMVGLGFLMAATGIAGAVLRCRGRLYSTPWLLRLMVLLAPVGFLALLAGWVVTEVGRQPYTVYGLLRTAESASPIATPGVATSLAAFAVVYLIVFGSGFAYLARLVLRRPAAGG
jgi:cytochrome d ubiquinol oxidase subunit I